MFWRVTSLAQSPVEAILDKGDFTLADLLDEDDVIQEARALNGRLVSFLAKRETVKQLVDYIVEPPPAGAFFVLFSVLVPLPLASILQVYTGMNGNCALWRREGQENAVSVGVLGAFWEG